MMKIVIWNNILFPFRIFFLGYCFNSFCLFYWFVCDSTLIISTVVFMYCYSKSWCLFLCETNVLVVHFNGADHFLTHNIHFVFHKSGWSWDLVLWQLSIERYFSSHNIKTATHVFVEREVNNMCMHVCGSLCRIICNAILFSR